METKAKAIALAWLLLLCTGHAAIAQRWERVADFEITRRMGAIAFSWQGKGYVGFGHDYNTIHPFNDISAFDPDAGRWEAVTWLDSGFRTHAFSFVLGDDLYVGGGTRDSGRTALQDFYRLHLPDLRWTRLRALPFKQAFGARAVICKGRPFLLGGCVTHGCEPQMWQYDAAADSWQPVVDLPVRSQFPIAFALDDAIYYGLGNGGQQNAYAGIWRLKPDSAVWTKARSFTQSGRTMSVGIAVDSVTAVAGQGFRLGDYFQQSNNAIMVRGRIMSLQPRPETDFMMSDFWQYDARKDKWRRLRPQKLGRRGGVSFVVGNYLYVGMGNAENRIAKDVYRMDLTKLRH